MEGRSLRPRKDNKHRPKEIRYCSLINFDKYLLKSILEQREEGQKPEQRHIKIMKNHYMKTLEKEQGPYIEELKNFLIENVVKLDSVRDKMIENINDPGQAIEAFEVVVLHLIVMLNKADWPTLTNPEIAKIAQPLLARRFSVLISHIEVSENWKLIKDVEKFYNEKEEQKMRKQRERARKRKQRKRIFGQPPKIQWKKEQVPKEKNYVLDRQQAARSKEIQKKVLKKEEYRQKMSKLLYLSNQYTDLKQAHDKQKDSYELEIQSYQQQIVFDQFEKEFEANVNSKAKIFHQSQETVNFLCLDKEAQRRKMREGLQKLRNRANKRK